MRAITLARQLFAVKVAHKPPYGRLNHQERLAGRVDGHQIASVFHVVEVGSALLQEYGLSDPDSRKKIKSHLKVVSALFERLD